MENRAMDVRATENNDDSIMKDRVMDDSFFFGRNQSQWRPKETEKTYSDIEGMDNKEKRANIYRAFLYALLSAFAYSLSSLVVKQESNIDVITMSTYFNLGMLVFNLPLGVYENPRLNFSFATWLYLILRGVLAEAGTILVFLSFSYLPLGDATVIIFSTPVFVTIFARIFFKERIAKVDIVTVVLTILGIALIAKLPEKIYLPSEAISDQYYIGILLALGALISNSSLNLVTRKLKSINISVTAISTAAVVTFMNIVLMLVFETFINPCSKQYVAVSIGFAGFIGQITMIRALFIHNAGPVSTTRAAADILFAFLWQVAYFHALPDPYSVSGAVIITFSILITGLKSQIFTLIKKNQNLFFIEANSRQAETVFQLKKAL